MSNAWLPRRTQGLYYVASGLWPAVFPHHYMQATGQESHQHVAQVLGVAVAALGGALALDVLPRRVARWAGIGTALALGAGAAYFVARGKGVPVNTTDGLIQLVFAGLWLRGPEPRPALT